MRNNPFFPFLLAFFFSLSLFGGHAQAQGTTPSSEALALIEGMTPEERVGQLFLISFQGSEITDESQIAALLDEYSVGGVILRTDQDNFGVDSLLDLYTLTTTLQRSVSQAARKERLDLETGEPYQRTYIPLLIGIAQDSESAAEIEILNGLSPLPSPMAIGATWQPALASDVGQILGSELSALGINLYLGPSLDILENPDPVNSGDLGTRSFGGDPFWVGEMGAAFVSGLHNGSDGKMLVAAKYFPGRGDADRSPNEEIATVRKTLEELKAVDLASFAAVTSGGLPVAVNADGLLIAHIRYQGFQGNIRPTTRPISLDEKSLSQVFTLQPFDEWRVAGGLTLSDDLGSRAVREFYAPGDEDFFAHLVARDAFLAGNDLLYMGNIISSDAPDSYTTITKTLDFFAQKYREDSAFAARVDEALMRILNQKLRLYPSFNPYAVLPAADPLDEIGQNDQAAFDVAQNAATLISPSLDDLDAILPKPPAVGENLLFITDTQTTSQCALCDDEILLGKDSLPEAILRLYGLGGAEEVAQEDISAYAFDDLLALDGEEEHFSFQTSLQRADWLIILLASQEKLAVLRQFLIDYQPTLRDKKIILFSFTSPYLLDATDISKLTAYYGLYSYAPPFLDVAARLLFKELTPLGAAPVSISGIGYDIHTITQPDPDQLLTLGLALPLEPQPIPEGGAATAAPTLIPMFQVGDTLGVQTGTIRDYNSNLVPDGTLVTFFLVTGREGGAWQQIQTETVGGIARANFQLEQTGLLDIRVTAGEAIVSETLRLDISDEGVAAAVTIIPPALAEAPTSTPEIVSTPAQPASPFVSDGKLRFGAWFVSVFLWLFGAGLAYVAGEQIESARWGLRWAFSTFLGGLTAYNYLVIELPGAVFIVKQGMLSVVFFILLMEILGWLAGWWWLQKVTGE